MPQRPGAWPQTSVGGVQLPAGKLLTGVKDDTPLLWMANTAGIDLKIWHRLIDQFHTTGLWPVALESLDDDGERPWRSGELGEDGLSPAPETHDVAEVLKDWWNAMSSAERVPEELAPFGREFPGLAPFDTGAGRTINPTCQKTSFLGLVPVTRPADVPWVLRWSGPLNHYSDMGALSAVLRSWEERFDAYVTNIGFATLTLDVGRPATRDNALAMAAEHAAMCNDNIFQGAGSIEEYAAQLVGAQHWDFWWD